MNRAAKAVVSGKGGDQLGPASAAPEGEDSMLGKLIARWRDARLARSRRTGGGVPRRPAGSHRSDRSPPVR